MDGEMAVVRKKRRTMKCVQCCILSNWGCEQACKRTKRRRKRRSEVVQERCSEDEEKEKVKREKKKKALL